VEEPVSMAGKISSGDLQNQRALSLSDIAVGLITLPPQNQKYMKIKIKKYK